MVLPWRLSYSKSPQVSRTLLSILVVLNNAVVWMVSTRPPTSKSSSLFNSPSFTVPSGPITIGLIVTFTLFAIIFRFFLLSAGTAKSSILQVLFYLLITIRSGLLAEIWWSVFMSKSHWSLYVSFTRTGAGLCINHLFEWSNFKFLLISPWIT